MLFSRKSAGFSSDGASVRILNHIHVVVMWYIVTLTNIPFVPIKSCSAIKLKNDHFHSTFHIVDLRSALWLSYDHWSVASIDTCSAPNILGRACFFRMAPSWPIQDGERGERVTNTLSGAKHGGHHHQERALVDEFVAQAIDKSASP